MLTDLIHKYNLFKNKYVVVERRKHEYFINKYYAHLIDPFFTKLAYSLNMSPNSVTVVSGLFGILAALSIYFGYLIWGAILLQLHHFMDGADGNLARLTNRCTEFGAKLDRIVDQIVRFSVFLSIVLVSDVSLLVKVIFIATIYLDYVVIQYFVSPFMKKYTLIRSRWKQWFLSKGIIPAFDIFLIYFLTSVFAIMGNLELLVYIVIIGKNVDWMYRVWECVKTWYLITLKK